MHERQRTLDLHEAADFLKISESTAQEMAANGEIPGAKIGRAWVFPAQGAHNTVRDNKRHPHTQTHNPKRAQEKTTRITTASRLSWNLADWRSASTSLDPYVL